jgi:pimeloyl-ACP methyl ester carboxylesterase
MHQSLFTTFLASTMALAIFTASADPISDRITVTARGHGPDVILIPGLATSSAVWDATAAHLEGHYRLHIVQVAGFAGAPTSANAQGPVIQPVVDALDAYIKTNKLKAPKVIGHSLGGFMGLMLAQQHPKDVDRLMIVDSFPFGGVLMGASDVADAKPQAAMMRDNIMGETQDAYAQGEKAFLPSLVKSPDGLKSVTAWAIASDKSVVACAIYEYMTADLRPKLAQIKTPVTMLYPWDASMNQSRGEVDATYQQNFAALPDKTLVCITNSYHFIMLDQPETFMVQVDKFLK